jgi:hypothetical protein
LPWRQSIAMPAVVEEAFVKVRKAADSGAFLFSEGGNEISATFRKELDQSYETYFEHLDGPAPYRGPIWTNWSRWRARICRWIVP